MDHSRLHIVFGGHVADTSGLDFTDPARLHVVGFYNSYAEAEKAWRAEAQRTVDDAAMKYVIVHLHRLLQPELNPEGVRDTSAA